MKKKIYSNSVQIDTEEYHSEKKKLRLSAMFFSPQIMFSTCYQLT